MAPGNKITSFIATLAAGVCGFSAATSAADCCVVVGVPEIDGPAGVGALALLISAGILVYRRFSK